MARQNPPRPDHEPWTKSQVWLGVDHRMKLDVEILRRKSVGDNKDINGKTIQLNRSAIIRDLIDRSLDIPDRLTLGTNI